jgi:hypothetical protein
MQCMLVFRQTVGAGYKDKWNRPMNRTNQTSLSSSSDAPILVDGHIPVSTDLLSDTGYVETGCVCERKKRLILAIPLPSRMKRMLGVISSNKHDTR